MRLVIVTARLVRHENTEEHNNTHSTTATATATTKMFVYCGEVAYSN